MKILGMDYGRKRIGLAICGPLKIAQPAGVMQRQDLLKDLTPLQDFIEEHEVEKIVIGHPKNMDNTCGEMAKEVEEFAKVLQENLQLPIVLWDERLTTWEAETRLREAGLSRNKRNRNIDAVAAMLILQSYVEGNL